MNEILAFILVSSLGITPILILLARAIMKNSIIFYLASLFILLTLIIAIATFVLAKLGDSYLFAAASISLFSIGILFFLLITKIKTPLDKLKLFLSELSKGKIHSPDSQLTIFTYELKIIHLLARQLNANLKTYVKLATDVRLKEVLEESNVLDKEDLLSKELFEIHNNYRAAIEEDSKRKKEEIIKNWQSEGVNKIIDTLRHNNKDLFELSFEVLSDLIAYVKANVGGIFMIEHDSNGEFLELIAAYAYDRRKFLTKRIELKEGLVGACAREKKTILLTKVPPDYMNISTGLGGADPRAILLVPLKIDEQIVGVMELASFNGFKKYEVTFIEEISENISSMLLNLKRQKESSSLLEKGRKLEEIISQKEEELSIQYEELVSAQDELIEIEEKLQEKVQEIEQLKEELHFFKK